MGVPPADPNFPFSLRFEPHKDVATLFPKDLSGGDYMAYMKQLPTVTKDANLYNIYAFDKPHQIGGTESLIGTLTLDGGLVSSKWGDEHLFIRHQKTDDDLKLHPEWEKYEGKYSLSGKCPFQVK